MKILYKKLLEIVVRHDYYLESVRSIPIPDDNKAFTGQSLWPLNYDLRTDVEIIPTTACSRLLQDLKIVFKTTATGFALYARATERTVPADSFHSFAFIEPTSKFSFILKAKNPYFSNFTNLRLTGREDYLYYFNNRSGNLLDSSITGDLPAGVSFRFLSRPMLEHGQFAAGELQYQLGDLVLNPVNKRVIEALSNIGGTPPIINVTNNYPNCSPAPGTSFGWQQLLPRDARYVTVQDRLRRQSPTLTYTRSNTNPGELIRFQLLDLNGNPVPLGHIPHTNMGQDRTYAPANPSQPVFHRIDLSQVAAGCYTLLTDPADTTPMPPFYWLDPLQYPDAFGVIELFAGESSDAFCFLDYATEPGESVLLPKTYEIRFRNRTTCWRYIKRDGKEPTDGADPPSPIRPRRSLSRFYTGYRLPGSTLDLPDASVDLIHPDPYDTASDLIGNIFSEIYLNEQYKIN